jgi:hypothetical protein
MAAAAAGSAIGACTTGLSLPLKLSSHLAVDGSGVRHAPGAPTQQQQLILHRRCHNVCHPCTCGGCCLSTSLCPHAYHSHINPMVPAPYVAGWHCAADCHWRARATTCAADQQHDRPSMQRSSSVMTRSASQPVLCAGNTAAAAGRVPFRRNRSERRWLLCGSVNAAA